MLGSLMPGYVYEMGALPLQQEFMMAVLFVQERGRAQRGAETWGKTIEVGQEVVRFVVELGWSDIFLVLVSWFLLLVG